MKKLTPEEKELWNSLNQNTKKYIHNKVEFHGNITQKTTHIRASISEHIHFEIERSSYQSLGLDKIPQKKARHILIEGTLDLHGLTQEQAQESLKCFFYKSQLQGKRWVKVITGKSGILFQKTPQFLQEISLFVSGYLYARACDGGTGALYIRIRKIK